MPDLSEIVITGLGVVTPIGIGRDEFWSGLEVGRCGIEPLNEPAGPEASLYVGATLKNFDAKQYVTPRKALKVMALELQTAYSASRLAWLDAGLGEGHIDPDRVGVLFGADTIIGDTSDLADAIAACSDGGRMQYERWGASFAKTIMPLWMLKSLPNMPACHVGIAVDARGPNNTIVMGEVGGLLALHEAAMIIQRGAADMMVVGSTGSLTSPSRLVYRHTQLYDTSPSQKYPYCLPYDRRRHGAVPGEGAGAVIIESREHAERRGAKPLARLAGWASRFNKPSGPLEGSANAVAAAASAALQEAGIGGEQLAHASGQAFSHKRLDATEAQGLHRVIGNVPVVGFSSYFGQLGGGCGIVELIGSVLSLSKGVTLPTLGFAQPDAECPVNVLTKARANNQQRYALKLNFTPHGQAAAVVIECLN
jgi:3-oxoacyl-[acyl-carrier-protein] synthase II